MGTDVILRLEGLTVRYGGFVAVDGLGLELRRGELFGLLAGQPRWRQAAAMAGVAVAWCLLLSLLCYARAEKRKPASNPSVEPKLTVH